MAVRGTNAELLIDEFDFSCDTNSLTVSIATDSLEHTDLCSTSKEWEPGFPESTIEHTGYYSGKGAGYIEAELFDRLGTATTAYVAALFGTDTAACPVYVAESTWGSQLSISAPTAELITLTGSWALGNRLRRHLRLFSGTISATGAKTAYDFGSAGSNGGRVYVFVQAITGTIGTEATIIFESATTEGGAYSTEATITFTDVGVQAAFMFTTVNRWMRIYPTGLGGATDFTVVCTAGILGVSY